MTTCCVAGYRPLRDIRPDESTWPPVLAPDGPWEICDCAEGDVVRRVRGPAEGDVVRRVRGPAEYNVLKAAAGEPAWTFQPPPAPRCRTCPVPPVTDAPIAWSEQWHAYLCAECAALLAEEKP